MNTDMISSDWLSQPIFGALPLEIKKFATQPNFNFRCVQIGLDYWMDGLVEHITMGQKSKGLRLFTFFLLIISLMILNIPKDLSTYLPTSNSLEFAQLNGTAKAVSDALEADTTTSVTPKEAILDENWNSQGGTIRRWGCDRRETPLIFVHIGKAGGGSVRARFAAAALDYKRWNWKQLNKDKHYYPVSDGVRDAKLCNSANQNFRIPNSTIQPTSFEGNGLCNATTPIGMAVACPQFYGQGKCGGCENLSSADCHTVYVGHNFLGTELHWLPPKYLENWWSNQWSSSANESRNLESEDGVIRKALASLMPRDHRWCPEHRKPRPKNRREAERIYSQCSVPLASRMDDTFRQFWRQRTNQTTKQINYAPLYASLPLHRVVMLREPFRWLVSKPNSISKGRTTLSCFYVWLEIYRQYRYAIPPSQDEITRKEIVFRGGCGFLPHVAIIRIELISYTVHTQYYV
jgi:hypothetical protein